MENTVITSSMTLCNFKSLFAILEMSRFCSICHVGRQTFRSFHIRNVNIIEFKAFVTVQSFERLFLIFKFSSRRFLNTSSSSKSAMRIPIRCTLSHNTDRCRVLSYRSCFHRVLPLHIHPVRDDTAEQRALLDMRRLSAFIPRSIRPSVL